MNKQDFLESTYWGIDEATQGNTEELRKKMQELEEKSKDVKELSLYLREECPQLLDLHYSFMRKQAKRTADTLNFFKVLTIISIVGSLAFGIYISMQ